MNSNVMNLAMILEFIVQQLPDLLVDKFCKYLSGPSQARRVSRYYSDSHRDDDDDDDEEDLDESLSSMGDDIWFDGVDKRLIEAHSKKVVLVKGDDKSLLTKTPLISYQGLMKRRKLKQAEEHQNHHNKSSKSSQNGAAGTSKQQKAKEPDMSKYTQRPCSGITDEIALDCEMVECYGHKSVLARISIVNLFGHPILDSYVAPPAPVTDYRTRYSGIRRSDLEHAPSFETVQAQVARMIKDRIVVGHAIHNDFSALQLSHPQDKTRDTSHYYGRNYFLGKTPSLKKLSQSILGITIQKSEHDSVQDAQATMKLYVNVREKWIEGVMKGVQHGKQQKKKQKTKPAKKKVKAFFVETI